MQADSAIGYFSTIAGRFRKGYGRSRSFIDKFGVITGLVNRYRGGKRFAIDVGCGAGVFTEVLAQSFPRVAGVDGAKPMVELCRHKVPGAHVQFLCRTLPLPAQDPALEGADFALCLNVLEYITDWQAALDSIGATLAPGGSLIVALPNPRSLTRRSAAVLARVVPWLRYYRHVRNAVTVEELIAHAQRDGRLQAEEVCLYGNSGVVMRLLGALGMEQSFVCSSFAVVFNRR